MKNNIWAKTVLTAHRYLERICDAIDKLVETNAVNSFYVTGTTYMVNNIQAVAEKIIELSQRKVTLINLKILIEKALAECEADRAELLIERYIEGGKGKDIAEQNNLSMRTYFRRLSQAESQFLERAAFLGYDEKALSQMLKNEKWIMEIYAQIGSKDEIEFSDKALKKSVFPKPEKSFEQG